MTKKWTLLCLAALLTIIGFPPPSANAAEAAFRISADRTEITAGDTVRLTVSGTALSDVYGYEAVVTYDTDKFAFLSAKNALPKGSSGESNGFSISPVISGNKVTFAYTKIGRISGISGDQPLAVFTFKAKKAGSAAIALSSVKVVHADVTAEKFAPSRQTNFSIKPGDGSGSMPIFGETNAGGTLKIELQPGDVQQAIQTAANGKLRIVLKEENGKAYRNAEITMPVDIVLKEAARIREIVIDTGMAVVTIPVDPARGVLKAGSRKMTLTVNTLDPASLPASVRNLTGSSAVLDMKLAIDGIPAAGLHGLPITVEIPYSLKAGEAPGRVVAYIIGGDGRAEVVNNSRYNPSSGKVVFKPGRLGAYAAAYAKVSFKDLSGLSWAQESVEALAVRDIAAGTGNGAFQPNRPITRAEFIRMLMGTVDLIDEGAKSTFRDIQAGAWYESAIGSAHKLGIVKGKTDGTFGVNDPIARQDMAVMIFRTARALEADLTTGTGPAPAPFADRSAVSAYALEAVTSMQKSGLIQGMGDGKFEPKAHANRVQAAVILYRLFERI